MRQILLPVLYGAGVNEVTSMKKILAAAAALTLCTALLAGCGAKTAASAQSGEAQSGEGAQSTAPQNDAASVQTQTLTSDPLTGFDLQWPGKRPVAVMINSDSSLAGQWGVSAASVMIEAVTTGQKTALMCLYPAADAVEKLGPVTAGDDLFLQLSLPLNAIQMQINKTVYAANLLNTLGEQDLDGYYSGTTCFDYDGERGQAMGNEFCWYTNAGLIQNGLELYGLSDEGATRSMFHFGTEQRPDPSEHTAQQVNIHYGTGCDIGLHYDDFSGRYLRTGADGADETDAATGEAVKFRNVFLLKASTGVKDDNATRDYDLSGGTGVYLTQGGWEKITWSKGDVREPLQLFAADGSELVVNPGPSYIGILGDFNGQRAVIYNQNGEEQEQ